MNITTTETSSTMSRHEQKNSILGRIDGKNCLTFLEEFSEDILDVPISSENIEPH